MFYCFGFPADKLLCLCTGGVQQLLRMRQCKKAQEAVKETVYNCKYFFKVVQKRDRLLMIPKWYRLYASDEITTVVRPNKKKWL